MIDFNQAYRITMNNEGGYADNPLDHGGETWRGIARNFWPHWSGWSIVDSIKAENPASLNAALSENTNLESLVLSFYKTEFWDVISLSALNDQQTANSLFDISVNMGSGTAAKMLQEAINTIPGNAIAVDEKIGPMTIAAANSANPVALYNEINALREQRYDGIIANNPSQAVFKNSWFSRIKPYNQAEADSGSVA